MESIRIDATLLSQAVHKTVRVVGQLKSPEGANGVLEANGEIALSLNDTNNMTVGNFYEVIAKVQNDFSLVVLEHYDFGNNINTNALSKMVEVVHKLPDLFQSNPLN